MPKIIYLLNGKVVDVYKIGQDHYGLKSLSDFEYMYGIKVKLKNIRLVKK